MLVTVLEGENTFNLNGVEKTYKAGDSFVELPGEVNQARNAGTTRMSVMGTPLLRWDAPLSRAEPGDTPPPPRPFTSYQFKTDVQPMAEPFDVVQLVQEFEPGAATPYHTHPGLVMVTVVAGELILAVSVYHDAFSYGRGTCYGQRGDCYLDLASRGIARAPLRDLRDVRMLPKPLARVAEHILAHMRALGRHLQR